MEKLKQNVFWVGLAAAGLVLVVFFLLGVYPLWGDKEVLQRSNSTALSLLERAEVPGDPDVAAWKEHRTRLRGAYDEIIRFYVESDKHLEQWFPGLPADPNRDGFMTKYRDEIGAVEKALREKGTEIGLVDEFDEQKRVLGFNWEQPTLDDWSKITSGGGAAEEKAVIADLQKRFWARQRVANAVLNGDVKVTRIHDFRFFTRLSPRLNNPPWDVQATGAHAVSYPGLERQGFVEYEVPNQLGNTITFGFAVVLPYPEVPKVIREILNPSTEMGQERLLLNILGTRVTVREQNPPFVVVTYTKGNAEEKRAAEEKAKGEIKAKDVMLVVTCQMIDFDAGKVKSFGDLPAPAAPNVPGNGS